ncbi:hypothetical protein LEM8419_01663 [Neolewinella maritima]|uniref:Outer membrane lipoprotein-sorting protein n=1 Tax=Neolewinella maritima TaxID=1383882 RepID=A0ABM9B136_9BACT|nr:DUF6503 family protein [Neolewinella maritima]CAH1000510.1 hypothetical protein LEM8419_01663 [Neolewinella maritima]
MLRFVSLVSLALLGLLCTCGPAPADAEQEVVTAEGLIDRAIQAHGMERWDSLVSARFVFRERTYSVDNRQGRFAYTRTFLDSSGLTVRDTLSNDGLIRDQAGIRIPLSTKDSAAYAGSVNSVRYFFMLPYGLQDPAVRATLLDTVTIDDGLYHRVEVRFDEEGGGDGFDDVYHYFFRDDTGELDYLAYTFSDDDGGLRFRKAINKRRVGGVLVQDYINYGVDGQDDRAIDDVDERYRRGELPELSQIINTEVRIEGGGQ